jgi:eukaryotic-like serine/threonine-protein kinase
VAELFEAALDAPSGEQYRLLARECAGQPLLLAQVKALLVADDQAEAGSFMREPALQVEARHLAAERTETRAGQTLNRYQLLEPIGEGGMGEVYLALDTELDRQVAVKLIKSNLITTDLMRRFSNERQILAQLNHPNIASLLDGGTTDQGIPFFVMEYVDGQPLDRYADSHGLSTTERLKLFRTVCDAVQYAHQNLIIHRDIKPTNILVTKEGEAKLLDFGIAKLLAPIDSSAVAETATVFRAMTPEYASPEQVKGDPITTATDVYSLGVVLYELLTGQRPHRFKSRQPADIALAICVQEPDKPSASIVDGADRNAASKANPKSEIRSPKSLRGDLDNIVLMAMRKDPQRRYATIEQFSEDIRRHLEGLPVIARKDTFSYRASKFIRRNKIGVAGSGLILFTLVGGIIATAWQARVARIERGRAERRFGEVRTLAHSVLFDYHDGIAVLSGSTAVRARLVKDSLQYVDRLAQEAGNHPALQLELAEAYLKLGDIQGLPYTANLGDTDGALLSYRKAQTLLRTLFETGSPDREVHRNYIIAYQRVGMIQIRQGDWIGARESDSHAVALNEALVESDPANAEYRKLLARSYLEFGKAIYQGEGLDEARLALQHFKKALSIAQALSAADRDNAPLQSEVTVCYAYAGYALWKIGDLTGDAENYRAALENERRGIRIVESLSAADPTNARYQHDLAGLTGDIGRSLMSLGDVHGALESHRRTISLFADLAAADPTNAEARRDLAEAHINLGHVMEKLGDTAGALDQSRQALRILEALQSSDPTSVENRRYVVTSNEWTGNLLRQQSDRVGARASYRRALAVLDEWLAAEPDSLEVRRLSAAEYFNLGSIDVELASNKRTPAHLRQENLRERRAWYQKSLEMWQEVRAKGSLTSAEASKADEVTREITRLDGLLKP